MKIGFYRGLRFLGAMLLLGIMANLLVK